jgi:hypothetical protein
MNIPMTMMLRTVKRDVKSIFFKLSSYENIIEAAALLELALWKAKMGSSKNDHLNVSEAVFRTQCRLGCGVDTVMSNVLPFLLPSPEEDNESDDEDYFDPDFL